MDWRRRFQISETKVNAFECPFDGGKSAPALPTDHPVRRFHSSAFDGGSHKGWDSGRQRVSAAEEINQCGGRGQYRDQIEERDERISCGVGGIQRIVKTSFAGESKEN